MHMTHATQIAILSLGFGFLCKDDFVMPGFVISGFCYILFTVTTEFTTKGFFIYCSTDFRSVLVSPLVLYLVCRRAGFCFCSCVWLLFSFFSQHNLVCLQYVEAGFVPVFRYCVGTGSS